LRQPPMNATSSATNEETERGNNRNTWYSLDQQKVSRQGPPRKGRLTWAVGTQVANRGHEKKRPKKTNNTGELLALLLAVRRASRRKNGTHGEVIWVDSLYARNMTMGVWLPKKGKNIDLVRELRAAWWECNMRRGVSTVRISHVRSHTAVPGNELVDRLAAAAAEQKSDDPDLSLDEAAKIMAHVEREGREGEGEEGGGRRNEGDG